MLNDVPVITSFKKKKGGRKGRREEKGGRERVIMVL